MFLEIVMKSGICDSVTCDTCDTGHKISGIYFPNCKDLKCGIGGIVFRDSP